MMKNLKKWIPDVVAVLGFLLISFIYFSKPISEGLILGGHDSVASIGQGRELMQHLETTGERTRWTNAIFSGMPTYQIAPTYSSDAVMKQLQNLFELGTDGVLSYVFLYLIGFYFLLRTFGLKPLTSVLGAIAWAFSSYFFIIISAGHIWKVLTLTFVPPTIAGLILCYRGKLLWGMGVTAMFAALQIYNNHVQMSYYFAFLMAFIVACSGVASLRKKAVADAVEGIDDWVSALTPRKWLKATGAIVVAGLIGVSANLPNLYHTYTYAKESMRGKAELTPLPSQQHAPTEGLDRDYITQWSYGIGETMTLLIPDFKGGGSRSIFERADVEKLDGYDSYRANAYQFQQMTGGQMYPPGIMEYWGDQPFTVGPVYVGAIICFFFVLGAFIVGGPLKWALLLATGLSLLFAWGKNFMPATDFFIDYIPMYNKFRTVSSALVVAEFTMPLLAVLALAKVLRRPNLLLNTQRGKVGFGVAGVLTAGVCLLLAVFPQLAGSCLSANDEATFGMMLSSGFPANFTNALRDSVCAMHYDILSSSALRSGLLIVVAIVVVVLYAYKKLPAWSVTLVLSVLCLADMWNVNKRYLNDASFVTPTAQMKSFGQSTADAYILQDTTLSYRVANLGNGSPFNETTNETSYYHKSIGGYNAAKLHRYQDLIDRHLNRELSAVANSLNQSGGSLESVNVDSIAPVLNMLNTKYFIFGQKQKSWAVVNPAHNGNAWFVEQLEFVDNADAEMAGLNGLDTKKSAVADKKFKEALQTEGLGAGTATLTFDSPNELHYTIESEQGGVVVFSEVYYPGWTATIDGEEAEVGRVNYVLRALRVPAGKHEVVMQFRPTTETTTTAIAYVAFLLVAVIMIAAVVAHYRKTRKQS